nr:unnamed protein product [Digitaria exilis]
MGGLGLRRQRRGAQLPLLLLLVAAAAVSTAATGKGNKGAHARAAGGATRLRFRQESGTFKVVQVADMHYADGRTTDCEDVLPSQVPGCSDLNTTAFLYRVFRAEDPDLVIFTAKSMDAAIAPAIEMGLPWAAVIGNHDQEGTLSREGVMRHLVGMKNSISGLNPEGVEIDGYGNYNLEVSGVEGTSLGEKSVLNLYFLDSGDYSTVPSIPGYGWIKASQQKKYMNENPKQKEPAPGLVFFHIPLPEFSSFTAANFTGVKQEGISSASINSGFFASMVEAGDVRAAFIGHDHINDFCGKLSGIQLCYAGGFGYHAYGKAGWSRRARVVSVQLEKTDNGGWQGVKSIKTWKRLDDPHLSTIDSEVLWNRGSNGKKETMGAFDE